MHPVIQLITKASPILLTECTPNTFYIEDLQCYLEYEDEDLDVQVEFTLNGTILEVEVFIDYDALGETQLFCMSDPNFLTNVTNFIVHLSKRGRLWDCDPLDFTIDDELQALLDEIEATE